MQQLKCFSDVDDDALAPDQNQLNNLQVQRTNQILYILRYTLYIYIIYVWLLTESVLHKQKLRCSRKLLGMKDECAGKFV